MDERMSEYFVLSEDVRQARQAGTPLVALESTVITHGLPRPDNLILARGLEEEVKAEGATPATIAVLDGKIHIGLTAPELERIAVMDQVRKVSRRDLSITLVQGESGGTTVSGTMIAARAAGIRVFATGGIGGVHRQMAYDISPDLPELARTPVIVVCAGAKAILDLPATIEVLETFGVPVIGYRTDCFPAFYSTDSGLPVSARAETPAEVAAIAQAHWDLGLQTGVLVVVPPPAETALPNEMVESAVQHALAESVERGIRGQAVTPFLLTRVNELTGGASLQSNLALLRNNARIAAQIARYMRTLGAIHTG